MAQMQQVDVNQVQTGKSSDPVKRWLMVVMIVTIGVAGFAGWQTVQLMGAMTDLQGLQTSSTALQADKVALQKELDDIKAGGTDGAAAASEKDKVLAASDAYARAPKAASAETFTYTITKTNGQFARVSVGVSEGGGYALLLKQVGANWTVISAGQDAPTQETLDKYGVPSDF